MRPCIAFLAVALLGSVYALDIHSLLDSEPTVDVNAKTCQLTQAQLDSILAGTSTEPNSYILIDSKLSKAFADSAAQLLAPSGFTVCQTTAEEAGLPGDVTIILQPAGKTVVYYGKRNAETLNLAVQKLSARFGAAGGPMFSTITNKMERKAFERLNGAKVVAFFADPIVADAAAFAEFQSAARQLAPNPPFYVVHDTHVSSLDFTFKTAPNSLLTVCSETASYPIWTNCSDSPTGEVDCLLSTTTTTDNTRDGSH